MLYQRLIDASVNALHTQFFKKKIDNLGRTILFGGSFDTTVFGDNFKDYEPYVSLESMRLRYYLKTNFIKKILH